MENKNWSHVTSLKPHTSSVSPGVRSNIIQYVESKFPKVTCSIPNSRLRSFVSIVNHELADPNETITAYISKASFIVNKVLLCIQTEGLLLV